MGVLNRERYISGRYIQFPKPIAFENSIQGSPIRIGKISLEYFPFLISTDVPARFFRVEAMVGKDQQAVVLRGRRAGLHFGEQQTERILLLLRTHLSVPVKYHT